MSLFIEVTNKSDKTKNVKNIILESKKEIALKMFNNDIEGIIEYGDDGTGGNWDKPEEVQLEISIDNIINGLIETNKSEVSKKVKPENSILIAFLRNSALHYEYINVVRFKKKKSIKNGIEMRFTKSVPFDYPS